MEESGKQKSIRLSYRFVEGSQGSLSELHQDIRRLMALAFPKLTAEAREEIACDHFTHALGDPDLALKVKERLPKSLDEACSSRRGLKMSSGINTRMTE